jgi:hypothetical protein
MTSTTDALQGDRRIAAESPSTQTSKENFMAASEYLARLLRRHRGLEDELAEALQHPSVGDFTLVELKRRKLRLKDQIARLTPLEAAGAPMRA